MNVNMSLKNDNDKGTSAINNGDNKNELIANMHTEVIHELANSHICPSFNKELKIIAIDLIDYVNYEEKVCDSDKTNTTYEDISVNKVNNVIHEQKNEKISIKHVDNTFEGCINICLDSPKKDSEINNELSKNPLITEFDEVLSKFKKADSTHNFRDENFSLGFLEDLFEKWNGDPNKYDLNRNQNNFNENPDSKLILKTDELFLTNTRQTNLENAKMNNKLHKNNGVNIDVSIKNTNKTEHERSINENRYNIATKESDAMMFKSENRMSVTNNKALIKNNIERIKSKRKNENAGLHSFKELETQVHSSKAPVKIIDNELFELESEGAIEKYVKLNNTDHNLENTKKLQAVCAGDNPTNLYKQCAEATLDTISISSTEDNALDVDKLNDSHCSGYHSSDFEFITESEAELNGILTNSVSQESHELKNDQSTEECGSSGSAVLENYNESQNSSQDGNNEIITRRNEIPQGDEYLNLFRGIYDPVLPLSHIYFLENKSVRVTSMNGEYEGIGFDVRMMHRTESEDTDDELTHEATETRRKIFRTYSKVNKKRFYAYRDRRK